MNDTWTGVIKTALPWIGTALGGPLGAGVLTALGSKLGVPENTVTKTLADMLGNPEQLAKAQALEQEFKTHMAEIGYTHIEKLAELEVRSLESVNKTIQSEAESDHWPSYSWRPAIGFSFALYVSSLWLLPLFKIVPVTLNSDIVLAIGGILGVASYFRGKAQANPDNPITKG